MEGDLMDNSSNLNEQSGGVLNSSCTVWGLVNIINW